MFLVVVDGSAAMLEKPFKRLRDSSGKLIRDGLGRYKYALRFRVAGRGSRVVNRRVFLADDLAAATEVARLRGEIEAVSGRYTWDEALALFLEVKTKLTAQYRGEVAVSVALVKKHCGNVLEKTGLSGYSAMLRDKAKATSGRRANVVRAHTLSVARLARAEGMIAQIPFENAAPRQENREGRIPFPLTDFGSYHTALDEFGQPLFLALAATGERVSALCGIDVDDLGEKGRSVWVTKKGGTRREIPLTPMFAKALNEALYVCEKHGRPNSKAVFINSKGSRWTKGAFRHYTQRQWKAAGLADHTIHSLRNMVASGLADEDFSRDTISASLGHDQTATADIYVKAREKLKAARNGLGDWSTILSQSLKATHDAPMTHQSTKDG